MTGQIAIPTTSVPVVDPVATDGQFVDDNGHPVPFFDPDGPVTTTTTDRITAGKTTSVATAAVGIQVGDWAVLTNGAKTDAPREVIAAGANGITVAEPFGIDATGTSTITRSRITPVAAWDLGGRPFGNLSWDPAKKALTGAVTIDTNVRPTGTGIVTVEIIVNGSSGAAKTQQVPFGNTAKCGEILKPTAATVTFGWAGPFQGKSCYIRAYAFFAFKRACNVRGGQLQLGPRKGPVFNVPA